MLDRRPLLPHPEVHVGTDAQHGVARCARELRDALAAAGGTPGDSHRVHVHFTDRLHGRTPAAAATWFERLAASRPATVTLHDLPQASDGDGRAARTACYGRVAVAARGVVVNSEHERRLLQEVTDRARAVTVIPLAMPAGGPTTMRPPADADAAVLGFFYPGKGHDAVVRALAELGSVPGRPGGPRTRLAVLGRASPGHERELDELVVAADRRGVEVEVTGYLTDDELTRWMTRVAVPVVAHEHVSASGSLNSWVAGGRRPLVRDGCYVREMAALRPGTMTTYAAGELVTAVARARREPESTWLGRDAVLAPRVADVAAAYAEWWARDVAW